MASKIKSDSFRVCVEIHPRQIMVVEGSNLLPHWRRRKVVSRLIDSSMDRQPRGVCKATSCPPNCPVVVVVVVAFVGGGGGGGCCCGNGRGRGHWLGCYY
jgi:hypothetical protein